MQITDLYQTKITCSTYNANIDSTDTVITVKLIDFNGAAVTNKSVTLTCDKGYFNKNGSTTISGTSTKSITATTDSSGEITATWTASEWGLCTFSTNNINTQIKVKGVKTYYENSPYYIYYDDEHVYFNMIPTQNYSVGANWANFASILSDNWIKPRSSITAVSWDGKGLVQCCDDIANIRVKSLNGNTVDAYLVVNMMWRRRYDLI